MVPSAVGRTVEVLAYIPVEIVGLSHYINLAGASVEISIHNTLAQPLWNRSCCSLLTFKGSYDVGVLLNLVDDGSLHLALAEIVVGDKLVIDVEAEADGILYVLALNAKLSRKRLVHLLHSSTLVP